MRCYWLLSLFLVVGCSDQEAEKLRRVGDKTYDRVAHAVQQVTAELEQTLLEQKPAVPVAPPVEDVAHRVRQRLAWDRELENLIFTVTVNGDVVTIQGKVLTEAHKQRVVGLAETTVGVVKVVAELEVTDAKKSSTGNSD
jgi:osmotically-inducible protein OsmY